MTTFSLRVSALFIGALTFQGLACADPINLSSTYAFSPIDIPGANQVEALGINNSGQVVGTYTNSSGTFPFLKTGNSITSLPFFPTDINNLGQVIGYSSGIAVYNNGVVTNIQIPNFFRELGPQYLKINDLGQIIDSYLDPQQIPRAFVYANGTFAFLPQPGDSRVLTNGINNAGQVLVTAVFGAANPGAYLYQNGAYTSVDSGSQGATLNNTGEVITANGPAKNVYQNGILAGNFNNLPYPGPYDLNDQGQILFGDAIATPVPEPASLLLLPFGLAFVMFARWRHIRPSAY